VALRRLSTVPLGLAVLLGPFASDAYLAALPRLALDLRVSAGTAQLTFTTYILGLAVGQVIAGPISDGRGRRPFLIGGAVGFSVLSAVCAVAPDIVTLLIARLAVGLVAGACVACARAVISDGYHGVQVATRLGTLATIGMLGPVIAPAIGAAVVVHGGWRGVFLALVGLGLVLLVAVLIGVPESLPPELRARSGLRAALRRIGDLGGDRRYLRNAVILCLATAGLFTYVSGSSFVLQSVYGISEATFATIFTVNGLAMVTGGIVFRTTVARVGATRVRAIGLSLTLGASVALLAAALGAFGATPPLGVTWALLSAVVGGMGMVVPASTALAQIAGRRAGGTAAALTGGGSFLVGALVSPLTGALGYRTLVPMAALIAGFMAAAGVFALVTRSERWSTPFARENPA
jgi:DHA1 family bicyclomycin/chloramphenicol resistance-like MFS transporter